MNVNILKKGISPVVAIALLLIVTIVAVMGFNSWYSSYQSNINANTNEQTKQTTGDSLEILDIIGTDIYLKNNIEDNLSSFTLKIDGGNCIINNLSLGLNKYNISSCLDNLTTNTPKVLLITENQIIEKTEFIKNVEIVSNSEESTLEIVNNGLVLEYLFENSGNLGEDTSGNGLNGTNNGAIQTGGIIGNSVSFDGINDYIITPYNSKLDFDNNFTISLWIMANYTYPLLNYGFLISKRESGVSGTNYDILLHGDLSNKIHFQSYSNNWESSTSITPVLEIWYFILAEYNGSHLNIYINNSLYSNPVTNVNLQTNIGDLLIGAEYQLDNNSFFKGRIDNLRIYNRTLNSTEIQLLSEENSN